jgi:hypothetical protein
VTDISLIDGLVYTGTLGINAPVPFGGQIDIAGNLCPEVDRFRVLYRQAGSVLPWTPMEVPLAKHWTVEEDDFLLFGPDCKADRYWWSDTDGWFDGSSYRHLTLAGLGGCNPGLALTIWESTEAVSGKDELYEVKLETDVGGTVSADDVRLVQLDNTAPVVEIEKPTDCVVYDQYDMPFIVTARISDTHFYRYRFRLTGDSYPWKNYPSVAYYDDPGDDVINTGTDPWPSYIPLEPPVDIFDLPPLIGETDPIDCGYTVLLTGWDRTLDCHFHYLANLAARCLGCRHTTDAWSFEYEFTPP